MLTDFLAWSAAGLFARVVFAHVLRTQWKRRLAIHPSVAGAPIISGCVLSLYAVMPFTAAILPIPFGLIFGFFVLDAVIVRL